MQRHPHLILFVILLTSCTSPTPEQAIVADAAAALGGRDRLLGANTLVLEGEGTNWNLGQDMTIDATGQTFAVTGYRRLIDLSAGRMRIEQTRTPNFLYFQGQAPQKQVLGIDGEVAYGIGSTGTATRASAQAARDRRAEFVHHPIVLVRAALDPASVLSNGRTDGDLRLVDITLANAGTFTLAIEGATGLPAYISSKTHHANLGDVVVETRFSSYAVVDALRLPERHTVSIDRFKTAELRLARPTVNRDIGDISAPEAARSAASPAAPATPGVTAEVIAPGVWLLGGGSHHSALVEFSDHLLLVEAPQSEARTLAAIAKARELVPGKPLTELVSSHHHFDHSAGLRAAVAEGLRVFTHQANVAFYEEAAKRPFTIAPDALARNPKPSVIEGVAGDKVLEDKTQRVELQSLIGNPHGDTIIVAYLPKAGLLVEADVFSPGSAVHPYAPNLLEHIRNRKLGVERIVPLHGTVVPLAELVKAVPTS
jgi:glyoxylase-like metal-dependent hydrolase (beta-lactamase superfamily II)